MTVIIAMLTMAVLVLAAALVYVARRSQQQDAPEPDQGPALQEAIIGLIDVLGRDGGYIPCAAHALQPDTPVENILTLYRTVTAYRY